MEINIDERKLHSLIKESVINILNESLFEKSDKKSDDKTSRLSAQAIDVLNDPMINNAEVGRELKDAGILHGSDDTIRSWVSKQRRHERPLTKGEPAAVLNISSSD